MKYISLSLIPYSRYKNLVHKKYLFPSYFKFKNFKSIRTCSNIYSGGGEVPLRPPSDVCSSGVCFAVSSATMLIYVKVDLLHMISMWSGHTLICIMSLLLKIQLTKVCILRSHAIVLGIGMVTVDAEIDISFY